MPLGWLTGPHSRKIVDLHEYIPLGAIGLGAACSAAAIYSGYAILFSTRVAVSGYGRFYRWIEAASGIAFGAIGGKLAIDAVQGTQA